jgi:hypothetical protein
MYVRSWFEWVDAFPTSIAFRESNYVYPATLTAHILGMSVLVGLVIMMDLRLLGVGNMRTPLTQVQKRLFPWQMLGMGISFITGMLLFYGQPMRFYGNLYFWIKAVMMVLAGLNALAFHLITYSSVGAWDSEAVTPFGAKLAGAISLVLWAGVVLSGRLIAYNWFG